MTEEQVKEGKAICDEIKKLEAGYKSIDNLSAYIADEKAEDDVEIQLVGTPYVKVNKTNLVGFLNNEKHRINLEIQSLREKLESM